MWLPCSASSGKCCERRIAGALVLIALNGPPLAVPGLGSKVSRWLGPPLSQSTMHDEAGAAGASACASRERKVSLTSRPKKLAAPTDKSWRLPSRDSIDVLLVVESELARV